jgi:hypothetical protein
MMEGRSLMSVTTGSVADISLPQVEFSINADRLPVLNNRGDGGLSTG